MTDADKLKIFISWSGDMAKEVTKVLHDWLPKMFDRVTPWMSEEDIDAGARGLDEIASELDQTSFGIIVVTQENQNAPWLNFEAGALSKRFEGNKSRVAPLLVDMTSPAQVTSPLKQFQANLLNLEGVTRLLKSIATAADADWANVEQRLKWSWEEFLQAVDVAKSTVQNTAEVAPRESSEMIEEILTLVRSLANQSRHQRAPEPRSEFREIAFKFLRRRDLEGADEQSRANEEYVADWMKSNEYEKAILDTRLAFEDSWELKHISMQLKSINHFLAAIMDGTLHPADIGHLAGLYGMGARPIDENSLRYVMLRHLAVTAAITYRDGLHPTPEETADHLGETEDPGLYKD